MQARPCSPHRRKDCTAPLGPASPSRDGPAWFQAVLRHAFRVHWSIAPTFLLTVPLLGFVSLALSKRIKRMQKTIVAETTALAGSTTESLRNIELVKGLGLAHQEVVRLNGITEKILKLELKKVKYLRSLSFIQGTAASTLRASVLFLMLYLIFRQEISVGQFFALMMYSFVISHRCRSSETSSILIARPRSHCRTSSKFSTCLAIQSLPPPNRSRNL
jgi:ABC-type multidrug transport system fused ATPase/permease subunit